MKPTQINTFAVRANCPDCNGAISNFDFMDAAREFGHVNVAGNHEYNEGQYHSTEWRLLRCSGCGRAGLSELHKQGKNTYDLGSFHPRALATAALPQTVPDGIKKEFREAELCASVEAWRAASALVRSTLEKTLKINGYTKGTLEAKIDEASADGVITAARKQKAHDDIRVLGNEVVHDDWREVTEEEVELALHYAQRILEDLYDDRESVEQILVGKGKNKKT